MTRWRSLRRWLGPVLSFDNRVTARAAGILRAGYAVHDYSAFEQVRLLLISVPEDRLDEAIGGLLEREIRWERVTVVLCDSHADTRSLNRFRQAGASVATVCEFHEMDVKRLLAEGDNAALTLLKQCLEGSPLTLVEVSAEAKPLYLAALNLLSLTFPTFATAVDLMRRAGFSGEMATHITERTVHRSVRAARNGRKGLSGTLATGRRKDIEHHLNALESVDPWLKEFYVEAALLGLEAMRANPKLAGELRKSRRTAALAASA